MYKLGCCLVILAMTIGFSMTPVDANPPEVLACAALGCNYDCTNRTGAVAVHGACSAGSCWTWGILVACNCTGCVDGDFDPLDADQICVCH